MLRNSQPRCHKNYHLVITCLACCYYVYATYKTNYVLFTGDTAPFHITQPSTDNDVQIVSSNATMASVTCSLNVTIPSTAIALWAYSNGHFVRSPKQKSQTGSTTTLVIRNFRSSDAGVYQCVFNDFIGSGFTLRRYIRLVITGMKLYSHACH